MKKLFGFCLLGVLFLQSCTKDAGSGGSNTSNITALTITADRTSLSADGYDEAVLTAKDQTGKDVTNDVILKRDGILTFKNQSFDYGSHGTYKYTATAGSVTSSEITINVSDPGPAKFTTKIIAEDFTGTWCGWCPRLAYKFERFMHYNPNIYTVGVHNQDIYALSSIESSLRAKFGINSFPSAVINRDKKFNDNQNIMSVTDSADLVPFLRKRAVSGISINSTMMGGNLSISAKVKFDANIKQALKLVVIVTEDGLVASQANYYNNNNSYPTNPYYSSGANITNFVHNGVLRVAANGIFGADIPVASQTKNNEYSSTVLASMTGINVSKAKVVAFVVFEDAQTKKGVLNAQWAATGATKNYD